MFADVTQFCAEPPPEPTGKRAALVPDCLEGYGLTRASDASAGGVWGRADDIALPDVAGTVEISEYLTDGTRAALEHVVAPVSEWPATLPDGIFLFTMKEWKKLVRRMAKAGMLALLPPELVARGPKGEIIRAGAFCVVKSGRTLRLIIDRRGQNACEVELPGLDLPAAVQFLQVLLEPEELLRLNLLDSSNYYYVLRVAQEHVPWNAVGPLVPAS